MQPSPAGHGAYLRSLARRERTPAYRRRDYLACEWQRRLWRDEVRRPRQPLDVGAQRPSPSSATVTATNGGRGAAALTVPSSTCAELRQNVVEWKYRVVDEFGERAGRRRAGSGGAPKSY